MSLRTKLLLAIGGTLCVLLLVLVGLTLLQERARSAQERALRDTLLEFAADLCAPAELVPESVLVRGGLHPQVRALAIYAAPPTEGRSPAAERHWGTFDATDGELARMVAAAFRRGETQRKGLAVAVPTVSSGAPGTTTVEVRTVVYLALRRDHLLVDPVERSQTSYLVIVGAGLLLLLVTWVLVDRVVARPLREVVKAAGRVAVGDYSRRIPETGREDDVERVVTAFNTMMEDLGRLQGRMKAQMGDVLAEARRTQDSLVIAQRLAATGRLAAGIAHEVNNPLAGMLEAVHALRARDMPPAKRDEYLELVEEGLRRIQVTVSRILQFTPHKVAPRPVSMEEIVRPVVALARHRLDRQRVEVSVEAEDGGAQVFGDPYELQQAVLNVVLNALDALEDAGRERPALLLRTTADDREVRLLVRDNGTGIPEEDLPRVFDLFFTTKEPGKGTGLGLATAHKIVTDHGGRIDLRSRAGEGVDVEFTLPRLRE